MEHSKKTIHPCPHCEFVSTIATSLRSHILTHTGEKPYKCPDPNCDYASTQMGPLQKHIKRSHVYEKPINENIDNSTDKGELDSYFKSTT